MAVEKIQDLDAYRNSVLGGTWSMKAGDTYEAGVTSRAKISGFFVLDTITITTLEDEDGDCLATYNLTTGQSLPTLKTVGANRRKPFTKIVFAAGTGEVDCVKED